MYPTLQVPAAEFTSRMRRVAEHARRAGLSGVVLFDNFHITYLSGFAFVQRSGRSL